MYTSQEASADHEVKESCLGQQSGAKTVTWKGLVDPRCTDTERSPGPLVTEQSTAGCNPPQSLEPLKAFVSAKLLAHGGPLQSSSQENNTLAQIASRFTPVLPEPSCCLEDSTTWK